MYRHIYKHYRKCDTNLFLCWLVSLINKNWQLFHGQWSSLHEIPCTEKTQGEKNVATLSSLISPTHLQIHSGSRQESRDPKMRITRRGSKRSDQEKSTLVNDRWWGEWGEDEGRRSVWAKPLSSFTRSFLASVSPLASAWSDNEHIKV